MKAFIISDSDFKTEIYEQLRNSLKEYLTAKGFDIEETSVGRDTLAFCKGCFGCWVKKPGECVINDSMANINKAYMGSDLALYLCPVVFGQSSANMKNAIDRWLPNVLPFFIVREDGSTMHPPRYDYYPRQILIGYGDALDAEDSQLFADIIMMHRRNANAFVYESDSELVNTLDGLKLSKVEGKL